VSDLQDMLRVQARLHRKQGANALGQLFESAIEEIQLLNKTYNQLFDAFQDCQGELAKANESVKELEEDLAVSNGFIAKKMPIVFAISGKNRGAKLVYEEAVKVLNKFAIEKKIDVLDEVESVYMKAAETSEPISFREAFDSVEEQLRREQE